MANVNAAYGLRPYKMLGSGANTSGINTYFIQTAATAGTSSLLYSGHPVIPLSTGVVSIVGAASGGTVPLLGAFIGCYYVDLTGKPVFGPVWPGTAAVKSGTVATALVADHPDQLFIISSNAAIALTDVFANFDFATATTGNAATGLSAATLDVSTAAATNTLNMRLVGLADIPDSYDLSAAGVGCIVLLNNHFYRYGANRTGQGY